MPTLAAYRPRALADPVIKLLKEDSSEHELVLFAIEMFTFVMMPKDGPSNADNGVMFTEMFVDNTRKQTDNVSTIIKVLNEPNLKVKRSTLNLLKVMIKNCPDQLQAAFLNTPEAIGAVMELLGQSMNEVVRNEALLLMIELTKDRKDGKLSKQIQKMVGFHSAFEKVLDIVQEEGLSDGSVIVEDCLTLAINLLKDNESNQTMFREIGSCVMRLKPFLEVPVGEGTVWQPQKVNNMISMLALIQCLVSPSNSLKNNADTHAIMNRHKFVECLLSISLSTGLPDKMLTPALLATADVIRGSRDNQAVFATVTEGAAFHALLDKAFDTQRRASFSDRCAALYCFQSALYKNPDKQVHLADTLLRGAAPGAFLLHGLQLWLDPNVPVRREPKIAWIASLALSHVIMSIRESKEKLSKSGVMGADGKHISIMAKLVETLPQVEAGMEGSERLLASYLMLLVAWLSECPFAVQVFLKIEGSVAFLLAQLQESSRFGPQVQGLAGVVLACCIAYNDGEHDTFSKQNLLGHIRGSSGNGVEGYTDLMERFINSDLFSAAVKSPRFVNTDDESTCWFDRELANLYRNVVFAARSAIAQPDAGSGGVGMSPAVGGGGDGTSLDHHAAVIASYKGLIQEQDAEMQKLKAELAALKESGSTGVVAAEAGADTSVAAASAAAVAQENDQLRQEVASLQTAVAGLQAQVDAGGSSPEDTSAAAAAAAAAAADAAEMSGEALKEAQATITKLQGELSMTKAELLSVQQQPEGEAEISEQQQQLISAHADMSELHNQLFDKENALEESQAATKAATDAREAADAAAQQSAQQVAQMGAQLEELQQQVASSESAAAAAAASAAAAAPAEAGTAELAAKAKELETTLLRERGENEDLLVFLAEQDVKIKGYRERLVAAGQEVSEDEDDDDDDSDDDDVDDDA